MNEIWIQVIWEMTSSPMGLPKPVIHLLLQVHIFYHGFPISFQQVEVLNHLMIVPSQLNLVSWAFIKFFQYWCDYRRRKSSLSLFFHFFKLQRSTTNRTQGQGLIRLTQVTRYFEAYSNSMKHFKDWLFLVIPLN